MKQPRILTPTVETEAGYQEAKARLDGLAIIESMLVKACAEATALKLTGKIWQADCKLPGVNDELDDIRYVRKLLIESMESYQLSLETGIREMRPLEDGDKVPGE